MSLRARIERLLRAAASRGVSRGERPAAWAHYVETGELSGSPAIDRGIARVVAFLDASGLGGGDWREGLAGEDVWAS